MKFMPRTRTTASNRRNKKIMSGVAFLRCHEITFLQTIQSNNATKYLRNNNAGFYRIQFSNGDRKNLNVWFFFVRFYLCCTNRSVCFAGHQKKEWHSTFHHVAYQLAFVILLRVCWCNWQSMQRLFVHAHTTLINIDFSNAISGGIGVICVYA